MNSELPTPLVIYDGQCKFCHWSIEFIISHESIPHLNFTWLQSDMAKNIAVHYDIPAELDSILFLDESGLYAKSNAAFRIASYLKAPYRWVRLFTFLPLSWTDAGYNLIARYRKKIMGSTTSCVLPKTDASRFF